jgi:S-adenosylmethionine:tRNA ribosyltransferase-isomerase
LNTDLFDYPLPPRLIAQKPADRRDESRLLVVHRTGHRVEHRHFRDLPEYLAAGDRLFRNNAAVIPARLLATRPTGGQVECLLLRPSPSLRPTSPPAAASPDSGPAEESEWWCLLRPGKKLPVGSTFGRPGHFTATVREKSGDGTVRVSFVTTGASLLAVADAVGEMPLPPYIAARANEAERSLDRERYQTVYADRNRPVAAAAPTAGLHFTPELLAQISSQGIAWHDLTLHVGLGTFRPITTDRIEDHVIHREVYELPVATQRALVAGPGRRIAVGTTSVRSIEDFLSRQATHPGSSGLSPGRSTRVGDNTLPHDQPFLGEAGIFIRPPAGFRGVDALITNFHQPRSTLLCLVSAFLAPGAETGIAWLKEIYAEAVDRDYRFFSYGDAMLIL